MINTPRLTFPDKGVLHVNERLVRDWATTVIVFQGRERRLCGPWPRLEDGRPLWLPQRGPQSP